MKAIMYRHDLQDRMDKGQYSVSLSNARHYTIPVSFPYSIHTRIVLSSLSVALLCTIYCLIPIIQFTKKAIIITRQKPLYKIFFKKNTQHHTIFAGKSKVLPQLMQRGFKKVRSFLHLDSYRSAECSTEEDMSSRDGEWMHSYSGTNVVRIRVWYVWRV